MSLSGRICVVTGASRGIGKGIALQLGQAGATVYITGRTLKTKDGTPGSLEETAKEVEGRGGKCIPVVCDHTQDEQVRALFEKVDQEQNGRLDVLVNNAYAAVDYISQNMKSKFWELDAVEQWDKSNVVGLRNHFLCTVYAARLMIARESGLIVNISSYGGLRYLFNVAYGIGKQAVDRMASDCGHELKRHKVAMVSLWPGAVRTEKVESMLSSGDSGGDASGFKKITELFSGGETTEYAGLCVVKMATDCNIMKKSGRIVLSRDLGDEYGFMDVDGNRPISFRNVSDLLSYSGWNYTSKLFPSWCNIPRWLMHMIGNKF